MARKEQSRGDLPIDKTGADLLFQVFSQRDETGSTIVPPKRAYKNWAKVFNNDATLTSAVPDRLLPHAETVTIEGKSDRMQDQIEEPQAQNLPEPQAGGEIPRPLSCRLQLKTLASF